MSDARDNVNKCGCALPKLSFERRFAKGGKWVRVDYCYRCQGVRHTIEGLVKEDEKAPQGLK